MEWAKQCVSLLQSQVPQLQGKAKRRARSFVSQLLGFLSSAAQEKWVCVTPNRTSGPWHVRPVKASGLAERFLWRHAERWLTMSATICDPDQFCRDLGIPRDQAEVISLPSLFPAERRPVYWVPAGSMARKAVNPARLVATLDAVIATQPSARWLVHTVSYRLASEVISRSSYARRMVTYHSPQERTVALQRYLSNEGSILVAPSYARGLDLPYDACRGIVWCKVPWLDLADQRVSARLYAFTDGSRWYQLQAAREIVQGAGRGMRAPDDYCETWILDSDFGRLRGQLPRWFNDAVQVKPVPQLT